MRSSLLLLPLLAIFISANTEACSYTNHDWLFKDFKQDIAEQPHFNLQPPTPKLVSKKLVRGWNYRGDSCGDIGYISFDFLLDKSSPYSMEELGFSIKHITGKADFSIPKEVIKPIGSFFNKMWSDHKDDINWTFEVRTVNKYGVQSEPLLIKIKSPGKQTIKNTVWFELIANQDETLHDIKIKSIRDFNSNEEVNRKGLTSLLTKGRIQLSEMKLQVADNTFYPCYELKNDLLYCPKNLRW